MATHVSYVFVGLAGDTGPGYESSSGLFRSRDGELPWESIGDGITPAPQVRAITVDPKRSGRVTIGTQSGIYRSNDHGDHWRRLNAPAPELSIWSLLNHPRDPDVMFAGYEPCAIYRTTDDGVTWQPLPVEVTFPAVTLWPDRQPKRVTGIAIDPSHPDVLYASIEVGGLLRSLDGGWTWDCVTEGLYTVDDAIDLHRAVVSAAHPGVIDTISRIGMFRSIDRGAHWMHVAVPGLRGRETYCRDLVVAPDDPNTLYLGAGTAFDGDLGAVFKSVDYGHSWTRLDLGTTPRSTIFAVAVDPHRPASVFCSSKGGEVFCSRDSGATWLPHPLPAGSTRVYVIAVG